MSDQPNEDELFEQGSPDIPDYLLNVMVAALEEGKEKIMAGELLVPFSVLAVKDNLFIESHPADDGEKCFKAAKHTVENARGAGAYAFCYDGYIETDDGDLDCVIAEGGLPGEPEGYAVGYIYSMDDEGAVKMDGDPVYVGPAPNFMWNLKDAEEYDEDELNQRYVDGEEFEEEEAEAEEAEEAE